MLCHYSLFWLKLVCNYGGAGLAALKGRLRSEVFVETLGDASEHQWLMSETKFNVDHAQMRAQACVRLAKVHDNTRVIPEPEQCLLGQRDSSILKALNRQRECFVSHIHEVFTS